MAIYHYSHKPVSRRNGQSAVAGAAYRSAEKLYDRSVGQTFDYSRRSGVAHAEIVLPTAAVKRDIQWAYNRQALWNAAEQAERRRDSRVAREHEIALPHELKKDQQIALLRAFAVDIANRYNVAVDFALHRPHRSGDPRNFHAHVYATTRAIEPAGLGPKASIELSDTDRFKRGLPPGRQELRFMRARWGTLQNEHLLAHGVEVRVDCRTLEAQGIDRVPTTHLGVAVTSLQRRGLTTQVELRIREQREFEARRRLERATELGRVAQEEQALSKSVLDLSGNIEAAKRERDLALGKDAVPLQRPGRSIEEIQREGREAWLALRAERQAKGVELPASAVSPDGPARSAPTLSLDEQRAQAIETWRKLREGPSRAPEEKHEKTKDLEHPGPQLEGPDSEP